MSVKPEVKELISKMKKSNATNSRALRELKRRAEPIAARLDESKNTAQQQQLRTIFTELANEFIEASAGKPDTISSRMDPNVYLRRKELVMLADDRLNQFQAPPGDRLEVMRRANIDDANSLGMQLEELTTARDGLLRDIMEAVLAPAKAAESTRSDTKSDSNTLSVNVGKTDLRALNASPLHIPSKTHGGCWPTAWESEPPRSPSPEAEQRQLKHNHYYESSHKVPYSHGFGSKISSQPLPSLSTEESPACGSNRPKWLCQTEKAHAQLDKKFTAVEQQGDRTPFIGIHISDMGLEGGTIVSPLISLEHTFGELADSVLNNDHEAILPDFWSKKVDHEKNRVTHSGHSWEWQDPSTKVLDVLMKKTQDGKKESLAIERVAQEGEYVVALIQKDKREGPMPVGIPRTHRQSASKHFQNVVFPDDMVSQVRQLESGDDVSEKVFDRRSFRPMSNPVFIEVRTGLREGNVEKSALGVDTGVQISAANPTTIMRESSGMKGKERSIGSNMTRGALPRKGGILVAAVEGK